MIVKPKLILNKFTGMNGGNGMYYLDGFSVEKENGMTSLDENYRASELVNSSTANYEILYI